MAEKETGKTRAHTIYKLNDGTRVPGTTTITGVLDKPALPKWANNLGLQGIDSNKYVDEKATIGTLAHEMSGWFIKNQIEPDHTSLPLDMSDYTKNQIGVAQLSFNKFLDWYNKQDIEPLNSELYLVSEDYRYGGTIDFYCNLNGEHTLVDFKTSKAIYPEHWYQLAAYETLLAENGYSVDKSMILRIGRNEDEGFDPYPAGDLTKQFVVFHHCLSIYQLQQKIRKGE